MFQSKTSPPQWSHSLHFHCTRLDKYWQIHVAGRTRSPLVRRPITGSRTSTSVSKYLPALHWNIFIYLLFLFENGIQGRTCVTSLDPYFLYAWSWVEQEGGRNFTGVAASMVGHVSGAVTRLQQQMLPGVYWVWCGAYQLDLAMHDAFQRSMKERF